MMPSPRCILSLFTCFAFLFVGCIKETSGPETPVDPPNSSEATFYKTGDQFKSNSISHIDGKGSNQNWLINNRCFFQYEHQVAWETEILNVSSKNIDVQFYIALSQETLLQSESEFKFRVIDDPSFHATWALLDQTVPSPGFQAVSKTGRAVILAAKQVEMAINLTPDEVKAQASDWVMKLTGVKLSAELKPPYLTAISKGITGYKVQVRYNKDLEFVELIETVEVGAKKLTESQLTSFFKNADWLLQHVINESAELRSGEVVKYPIGQGGSFVPTEFNASARGYIKLSKQEGGDGYDVHGGRVSIRALTESGEEDLVVNPASGTIHIDKANRFVDKADLRWDGRSKWPTKHLMFETKAIRNANVITKYETHRVE